MAEFSDFREVDRNKWIAMPARASNLQPGHVTEILFSDYRVDASVPKETFSARAPEFGG